MLVHPKEVGRRLLHKSGVVPKCTKEKAACAMFEDAGFAPGKCRMQVSNCVGPCCVVRYETFLRMREKNKNDRAIRA
jgi:hypothetical protein